LIHGDQLQLRRVYFGCGCLSFVEAGKRSAVDAGPVVLSPKKICFLEAI
jgi:hypothetical protein